MTYNCTCPTRCIQRISHLVMDAQFNKTIDTKIMKNNRTQSNFRNVTPADEKSGDINITVNYTDNS